MLLADFYHQPQLWLSFIAEQNGKKSNYCGTAVLNNILNSAIAEQAVKMNASETNVDGLHCTGDKVQIIIRTWSNFVLNKTHAESFFANFCHNDLCYCKCCASLLAFLLKPWGNIWQLFFTAHTKKTDCQFPRLLKQNFNQKINLDSRKISSSRYVIFSSPV